MLPARHRERVDDGCGCELCSLVGSFGLLDHHVPDGKSAVTDAWAPTPEPGQDNIASLLARGERDVKNTVTGITAEYVLRQTQANIDMRKE